MEERRLRISIPKYELQAEALLHCDLARVTTGTIWSALATPMTTQGIHAMWVGPEIMMDIPVSHRNFHGRDVPPENQTSFPIPGDLVWFYFPVGTLPGLETDLYEFGFVYDRNARMFGPTGWLAGNVFGSVTSNLREFASALKNFRTEGCAEITVSRLEY